MRPDRATREIWLVVLALSLVLLFAARCAGDSAARADRDREVADSVAAAVEVRVHARNERVKIARQGLEDAEQPHTNGIQRTDRTVSAANAAIARAKGARDSALAAAADSSRTAQQLREALRVAAAALDSTVSAQLRERVSWHAERRLAQVRIDRATLLIEEQDSLIVQLRAQVVAEQARVAAADRQRPGFWRRVLTVSCVGSGAAGGAAIGTALGGPAGAAIGAASGAISGAVGCR